ncbi:MAG: beta-propeller fold lactonase family protein, partial [Acidimicrobiales bacterium]
MTKFMRRATMAALGATLAVGATVAGAGAASAAAPGAAGPVIQNTPRGLAAFTRHAVFVQTDDPDGNQIVAYDQAANGTLTAAGTYATGGDGAAAAGSVVDPLASQGSLALTDNGRTLIAVNAGSDTVSVFRVTGASLALWQIVPSGGPFPVSIAVDHGLVYVLDAGGAGALQGYA